MENNYPEEYSKYISLVTDNNISVESINSAIAEINSLLKYSDSEYIIFSDSNLEYLIRKYLNLNNSILKKEYLETVSVLFIDQDDDHPVFSLDDLKYFKNLNILEINNCYSNDYSIIGYLENLTSLTINLDFHDSYQIDYSFLINLKKLMTLTINDFNIKNFDFLLNLNSLISFSSNVPVNDFSALYLSTSLTNLSLCGIHLQDLSIFCSYQNLKSLSVVDAKIDSFAGCESLQSLTSLDVSGSEISGTDYLINCSNLLNINFSSCNLADVGFLTDIPLNYINLSNNSISKIQLGKSSVIELNLSNNTLTDLDLSEQKNISIIDVSNNKLKKLILPNTLEYLTSLNVSTNNLYSLSFKSAPNLISFYAADNAFSDISFLASSVNLKNIILDNNPITNLDILSKCNLSTLSAYNTNVSKYGFLSLSKDLIYLNIGETIPNNLSFLYDCNGIETFYVNLYSVSDYSPLSQLSNIKNLYLKNANNSIWDYILNYKEIKYLEIYKSTFDYIELHDLPLLEKITILKCRDLTDISMMYDLSSLSEMYFENVDIFNPYILDFPNLKKISIIDGNVETVENINNLPQCTYIDLSDNNSLDNITFNLLPLLKTVILKSCSLKSDSLKNLSVSLTDGYLDLSNNRISSLKYFSYENVGINTLNLSNNKIKDFSPIYSLQIPNVIADGNRGKYSPQ